MYWLILHLDDGSRIRYRLFPDRPAAVAFGESVVGSPAGAVLGVKSFSVRRSRRSDPPASDLLGSHLQWDWCKEVPF